MALRQLVPEFAPAPVLGVGDLKSIPVMREAPVVEFRAGIDMDKTAADILSYERVVVEAAVAAGKSTRLPLALAKKSGLLVVHLCPNRFLAADLARYVASLPEAEGVQLSMIEQPAEPWPASGIVYVSTACLFAKWMEAGSDFMPPCVVFHDESHESDGYNYLARTLLPVNSAVRLHVSATATRGAANFRAMESAGKVHKRVFPEAELPGRWDVLDSDKPWAADSCKDHVLFFEDDRVKAANLVAGFSEAGWQAYRFHAGMGLDEFNRVVTRLRLPNSPLMAIIADSTFRSGFTFPVARIFDSGLMRFVRATDGKMEVYDRKATELERYQAAGRGGRIRGLSTEYWQPSFDAPAKIYDLEASELDLAALGLRLLGYKVPAKLSHAFGAKMGVPRELSDTLRGKVPLGALKSDQLVSFEEFCLPSGRRSPFLNERVVENLEPYDLRNSQVSADTARLAGMQGLVVDEAVDAVGSLSPLHHPVPVRSKEVPVRAPMVPGYDSDEEDDLTDRGQYARRDSVVSQGELDDALREVYAHEEGGMDMVDSVCYVPVGVDHAELRSPAFPDGDDSVLWQLVHDVSRTLHTGYDHFTRGVAVNLLLRRRNSRVCGLQACRQAIMKARGSSGSLDRESLSRWASQVVSQMTVMAHDLRVVDGVLVYLMDKFCSVRPVDMTNGVQALSATMMQQVDKLPSNRLHARAVSGEIKMGVSSLVGGSSVRAKEKAKDGGALAPTVMMPVHGRGMRASKPGSFIEWVAGPVAARESRRIK